MTQGSTVRCRNEDPFNHNVFSKTNGGFDTGVYGRGKTRENVFGESGVYSLYCNVHPRMTAFVVTVNPVNDRPTIDAIANPAAVNEDAGLQTVSLSGITAGPNDSTYITETIANRVGVVSASGALTEVNIPTANASPLGIAYGADGGIWGTEVLKDKLSPGGAGPTERIRAGRCNRYSREFDQFASDRMTRHSHADPCASSGHDGRYPRAFGQQQS